MTPEAADSLAARLLGASRTELGGHRINHARRVAARVRRSAGGRLVEAALLHDVVATGRITIDELRAEVADERLVELVEALTRLEGETDEHYLARCAADPIALMIKRADLVDNLVAYGTDVPIAAGLRARRQASRQLALLNLLAQRHRVLAHRRVGRAATGADFRGHGVTPVVWTAHDATR